MGRPLHVAYGSWEEGPDRVVVTPEAAGWAHAGLRVVELEAGEARSLRTGSAETLVVPLAGSCTVGCEGQVFGLEGRRDVFSRVSDFAYVPVDSEFLLRSDAGGRFALPNAKATRRLEPAYGRAEGVPVEIRGAGQATRQLNNICDPDSFPTDKLVVVECITPSGNWSSYPPHKHDECRAGEAILEEIYYFEVSKALAEPGGSSSEERKIGEGFAFQRLYTHDGEIDLCAQVRQGDVVLIPRGYHGPSMTAPGYDLYYMNVLAGPGEERTMAFCDDPAHHWIRESWSQQRKDPRLPVATVAGPRTGSGYG